MNYTTIFSRPYIAPGFVTGWAKDYATKEEAIYAADTHVVSDFRRSARVLDSAGNEIYSTQEQER